MDRDNRYGKGKRKIVNKYVKRSRSPDGRRKYKRSRSYSSDDYSRSPRYRKNSHYKRRKGSYREK